MLYGRRRNQRGIIRNIIILGILGGIAFFIYDNLPQNSSGAPTVTTEAPNTLPTPLALPTLFPTAAAANPVTFSTMVTPAPNTTIFIPAVGVYAPVITAFLRDNTWDVSQLGTSVGYLQGTSWLGQNNNIVLSGHVEMSDGRTGVFSSLDGIALGDSVVLMENGSEYYFRVDLVKEVAPDDLSVVYSTPAETLTLITCSDYNFVQNTYDTRLVVVASRVNS